MSNEVKSFTRRVDVAAMKGSNSPLKLYTIDMKPSNLLLKYDKYSKMGSKAK